MFRPTIVGAVIAGSLLPLATTSLRGQEPNQQPVAQPSQSRIDASLPERPSPSQAFARRWLEVENATLNLRFRYVDDSAGTVTTKQLQWRVSTRGRLKIRDEAGLALNFGLFTGTRFSGGWDNTSVGMADAQRNIAFKTLYLGAQPMRGVEAQVGGVYLVKGESTELTTHDDDGYIMGERLSLRRPDRLFFDEISLTGAYFTVDPTRISVAKRIGDIDEPNYWHFLVRKSLGDRGGLSADYTTEVGRRTWRQALRLHVPEARIVDSFVFEHYYRTNFGAAYGFSLTFTKRLTDELSLNQFGYASIDPGYGPLIADRFNIGKRVFGMVTYTPTPYLTASFFITTAVGSNTVLPQRTLSNAIVTLNALPVLRRTGYF